MNKTGLSHRAWQRSSAERTYFQILQEIRAGASAWRELGGGGRSAPPGNKHPGDERVPTSSRPESHTGSMHHSKVTHRPEGRTGPVRVCHPVAVPTAGTPQSQVWHQDRRQLGTARGTWPTAGPPGWAWSGSTCTGTTHHLQGGGDGGGGVSEVTETHWNTCRERLTTQHV